ncbi:MAG: efflux RND transporter permease subunit [Sediminimonas sp.]|uniref:efflux RND transporter permease subunit n=1 Tax=Sediminimonas sp. TaxID=2823379 RepID=UPI002870AAA4|nr:efflux RND transporter permease subunit [Sediminimonas sp.]MDR9484694.1 efflux RND transporter permease subunit [Sediminimonas sp.]
MRSLTGLGLRNTRVTVLFMILILALGLGSFIGFPKREDPAITVRTAVVTATNPGLTLTQLEELVARPLEEAARAIPGVDEVRTQLISGTSILQIDVKDSVAEGDIAAVLSEIDDEMEDVRRDLPKGTQGPFVNTDFGDVAIATIAVRAHGFLPRQAERFAEDLRNRIYVIDAVSAVRLHGVQQERIWLNVDRERLATVGTTLLPVIDALQTQNVRLPSGSIVSEGQRIPLETSGDFTTIKEIEDMLVELPDIGLIRLGDLVTVERGLVDPVNNPVYFDGVPAILLSVEMDAGNDITAVGEELKRVVGAFEADQPLGVEAEFSTFQPKVVEDSINEAMINMLQTFAVVLLVMFVFLGYRQALVIASIIPFAVAFAFTLMPAFGVELQQVSIAAIIISLGLVVDNGLVIVEDMDRRIRGGAGRWDAAMAAGQQYTVPLLIASITTIAVFLPLYLLEGTEGQFGYSLGVVVALMLTGSFLSAIYLLPLLAYWFLPEPVIDPKPGIFDLMAAGYGHIVAWIVRVPWLAVAAILLIVVMSVSQMGGVRQQLFPLSERSQFLIYFDLPRGTDISRTEAETVRLSEWLADAEQNPEVNNATAFVGFGGPRFVLSLDPADRDPASSFVVVNTTTFQTSQDVIARTRAHIAQSFPDARVRMKRLAMGGREPGIEVELTGPDPDRLLAAAYEVENAFADAPGMVENQGDWGNRILRGRVVVAQDRAREYGLTSQAVSDALAGFLDGTQISVFRDEDRQIPIVLRGEASARDTFGDLANLSIVADGQLVALDQIAEFTPELEFSSLRRVNQRRVVTVSAMSSTLSAYDLVDHVQPALDRIAADLGPAYAVTIGGEVEQSTEVRTKLAAGFPATIVVMLIALMMQFNSFRRVGLTVLCIPLIVAGVPLILIVFDQPFSFFGTLGLIALSGIIINNAIVLIDQIDIERQERPLNDAITEAAKKRFQPILLTSLTTVLGLTPMAIAGGGLWEPMATLMIGGLGMASALTLAYVPALYRIFFGRKHKLRQSQPGQAAAA